jgi:WD40 repeat protein
VTAIGFSPDGTRVATGSGDSTVRAWDPATGQHVATLTGHGDLVTSIAFSPDGTRVATASRDTTARTWDPATGQHTATLAGHTSYVTAIAWAPGGTQVATASSDHTARIWDVGAPPAPPQVSRTISGRILRRPPALPARLVTVHISLQGHQGTVTDIAFHPARERVFTASDDGTVRTWRLTGGPAEHVLTGHNGAVTGLAFSPDGGLLATSSEDGTARIWSTLTLKTLATLVPLDEGGFATLLPDGSYKLQGDPAGRLWWALKLRRFGPGELDPYLPGIRRLPADAPILPS